MAASLLACFGAACSDNSEQTVADASPPKLESNQADQLISPAPTRKGTLTGHGTFTCSRRDDHENLTVDVSSFDSDMLWASWGECEFSWGFVIRYSGEIDKNFEHFMALVNNEILEGDKRDFFTSWGLRLELDSAGGDVDAAMRIGDALGRNRWLVAVAPTGRCMSACVFLFAAGGQRVPSGPIGIHRIRVSGSSARSPVEMDAELANTIENSKAFMTRNGVSPAIVDFMMTIPSAEVRLLGKKELNDFGLSFENAVQKDIDRNALIRRCGDEYAAKLMAARASWAGKCIIDAPTSTPEVQNACKASLFDIHVSGSWCSGKDERFLPQTP